MPAIVDEARAPAAPARASLTSRLFSFPAMLVLGLSLVVFLTCRGRYNDPDTWWHLKVGEIIWTTGSLPRADLLSYTTNQRAWVPHEWLAELSMNAAYRAGGPRGLLLWLCVLSSLLVVGVYALSMLHSGNAKVALLGGMAAWFFGTISLSTRPLILGHLFLVVELLALQLARVRDRRWLWVLPPLFAVWVNCHGSWMLGLLVLAIALGCSFVRVRAGLVVAEPWDGRYMLAVILLLSAGALFVNPVGAELVTYPLDLFTKQSDNLGNVSEWASLDFQQVRGVAVLAVAGGIVLLAMTRGIALRLEELVLLALGFGMAVRHTRMLFIFGILAAPVLCRMMAAAWRDDTGAREHRMANAVLMAVAVAVMAVSFPATEQLDEQTRKYNPAGAVAHIRRANLAGPMLNEYLWGGYLIWAMPERKVFIDGRADIYDWTGVLAEYGRWYTLEDDPQKLLDKYGIRFCLLRPEAPMAKVMPYLPGWERAYADEVAVIFRRSGATAAAAVR